MNIKKILCISAAAASVFTFPLMAHGEMLTHESQINVAGHLDRDNAGKEILLYITDSETDEILYINQAKIDEYGDYKFVGKLKTNSAADLKACVNYNGTNVNESIREAKAFSDFYNIKFAFTENGKESKDVVEFEKEFAVISGQISGARVVTAYYDENDKLLDCSIQEGNVSTPISDTHAIPDGTKYLKCFIWSDDERQIPLIAGKERIANQSISCWGDSLTMCSNSALKEEIPDYDKYDINSDGAITYSEVLSSLSGKTVNNYGVGGENATAIAIRQGAVDMFADSFTIPAGTEPVQISISAENGYDFHLMKQASNNMWNLNPVVINGIEGELSTASTDAKDKTYYFTRKEAGYETEVPGGTKIITAGSKNSTEDISVLFVGTNGGFGETPEGLINIIDAMIDQLSERGKDYVVVGLPHHGETYEKAMQEKYGSRFVPLYSIMNKNAAVTMEEYGITMTDADKSRIANGQIPISFLAAAGNGIDTVHFSAVGCSIVGNEIYKTMLKNGMLIKE